MPIRFECPSCNSKIRVPDNAAGKKGKCPKYSHEIVVPSMKSPDPLPVPKPPVPVQQSRKTVWLVVGGVAAAGVCGLAILVGATILILSTNGPTTTNTKEEQKQAGVNQKTKGDDQGTQKVDKGSAPDDIERLLAEGEKAIERRELQRAADALSKYAAHPTASRKAHATTLLQEIALATSDEKALEFLSNIPLNELEGFLEYEKNPLKFFGASPSPSIYNEVNRLTNTNLKLVYRATLHRNCAKELASSRRTDEQKRKQLDALKPTFDGRFAVENRIQADWARLKLPDPAAADVIRRLRELKFDCDGSMARCKKSATSAIDTKRRSVVYFLLWSS